MELPSYFKDFLKNIRPTDDEVDDYIDGHTALREKLLADPELSPVIVGTFLQGSYRRFTAIKAENGQKSDVDVVVATSLSEDDYTAAQALDKFTTFLDKHSEYKDNYEPNAHSIAIELQAVKLDLVVTSAPSEIGTEAVRQLSETTQEALQQRSFAPSDDWIRKASGDGAWKLEPLRIPDRDNNDWEWTHPLEQIRWTTEHNQACNGHYVNVVKALKWWRRAHFTTPKHPKGYPLEHLIGTYCPKDITSVAEGVTLALEGLINDPERIVDAILERKPVLWDRGIPENNVFERIDGKDFAQFFSQAKEAAKAARKALDADNTYDSANCWIELFGDEFPEAPSPDDDDSGDERGDYTPRKSVSIITPKRFG